MRSFSTSLISLSIEHTRVKVFMILPVLQYPDSRLERLSVEVEKITPEIVTLAENMVETMYARNGIGLAAPQVGENIRLIVVDVSGPEERSDLMVVVNPRLALCGTEIDSEEGCLSVPDYNASVVRSDLVKVEGLKLDGTPFSFEAEGMKAICLQHECDHLDGKLFIDKISRLKRSLYDKKILKGIKR